MIKMKKYIAIFIFILFSSCEKDFLNVVPDNIATIDLAFNNRATAERFLSTCYTYIPEHAHIEQNFSLLAGDENAIKQGSVTIVDNLRNLKANSQEVLCNFDTEQAAVAKYDAELNSRSWTLKRLRRLQTGRMVPPYEERANGSAV